MRVYIAGPITGYADLNRPAFREAAKRLVELGHEPVNPHDIPVLPTPHECRGEPVPRTGHAYGCFLVPDLHALLDCDGYTLLAGWHLSKGARAENRVAEICGKTRVMLNEARF